MCDEKMDFDGLLTKYNGGRFHGAASKLAKALAVTNTTVGGWREGELPGPENQVRIAKELKVSVETLRAAFAKSKTQQIKEDHAKYSAGRPGEVPISGAECPQFQPIGIIGVVSAGSFDCPVDAPPDEYLPIAVPSGYKPGDVFGLRISGDCMEPTARSGDYAIIAKATEARDGQLYIVRVDGECTFKRIYKKGDCVELKPDNPKFKTLRVAAKHAHIVGRVLMFCRKP